MISTVKKLFGICLLVALSEAQCDGWNYNRSDTQQGPAAWGGSCQTGRRGSPINIDRETTVSAPRNDWNLVNWDKSLIWEARNTADIVQFVQQSQAMTISGGAVAGTYRIIAFHFHRGSNNSVGSAHSIDRKFYPIEVHLVGYNDMFTGLFDAFFSPRNDSIAIWSFFGEINFWGNMFLMEAMEAVRTVGNEVGSTTQLSLPPLLEMFPQILTSDYYRYDGSGTTPGCEENTVFTVFSETFKLSNYQMDQARYPNTGNCNSKDIYRPQQPLNGRQVTFYNV